MKKLMLIAVVGLFLGSLTSCKKDYTCDCVDGDGVATTSTTISDSGSTEAEAQCILNSSAEFLLNGGSCSIND